MRGMLTTRTFPQTDRLQSRKQCVAGLERLGKFCIDQHKRNVVDWDVKSKVNQINKVLEKIYSSWIPEMYFSLPRIDKFVQTAACFNYFGLIFCEFSYKMKFKGPNCK